MPCVNHQLFHGIKRNDVTQWNHEKLKSESGGSYSVVGDVDQK